MRVLIFTSNDKGKKKLFEPIPSVLYFFSLTLQLGTMDVEIKASFAENPQLSKALSFKPGVD